MSYRQELDDLIGLLLEAKERAGEPPRDAERRWQKIAEQTRVTAASVGLGAKFADCDKCNIAAAVAG